MRTIGAAVFLICVLSGCKPPIAPTPVPQSSTITNTKAPCEDLTYAGFPQHEPAVSSTFFVCRGGYALNVNPDKKTPEWVVERLTADHLNAPAVAKMKDEFRADPLLAPSAQAQLNDYKGTGYEKALMAPAENYLYDDVFYSQSFYLSNALPQNALQAPVWKEINRQVQGWAKLHKDIYVVSGPVYLGGVGLGWVGVPDKENAGKNANKGKVQVPTHFYKVVISPSNGASVGFLVPNSAAAAQRPLRSFMVRVADIEFVSGIRFAPDLSLENQGLLKTGLRPDLWPIQPAPRSTL